MAFKFVILVALVAYAQAGVISSAPLTYSAGPAVHAAPLAYAPAPAYQAAPVAYAAPVAKAVVAKTVDDEYDPNPQYSYSYDVHDQLTGDAKTQQETRNGDVVQGSYSLVDPDGTRRTVEYTADPHNGFNAVVHKEPATIAVKAVAPVVKTVATAPVLKTVAAAPVLKTVAAPVAYATHAAPTLAYSAPVAHATYSAPTIYKSPLVRQIYY